MKDGEQNKWLKVFYFKGKPEEIGRQHGQLVLKPDEKELKNFFGEIQQQMKGDNFLVNMFKDLYAKLLLI